MKHSNFENELNEIRRRAINELKDAVEAHGGSVSLEKHTLNPVLLRESRRLITKIFIKENEPSFVTYFVDFKSETIKTKEDFCIEDILAIIEAIPETDEVEDVSGAYPVPVTWVDRDDIESAGYDSEEVTQEQLGKIAERMGFGYVDSGEFYSSLSAVCGANGLKEKED